MPDPDVDVASLLLERLLEAPPLRRVLERAEKLLDRAGQAIDGAGAPRAVPTEPREPTQEERRARALRAARRALMFGPDDELTAEAVRERRRKLAKAFHPDTGGDPEIMARINRAADLLEKHL